MIKKFLGMVVYGGAIALGAYLMTEIIDNVRNPYRRAKLKRKLKGVGHKFKIIKRGES